MTVQQYLSYIVNDIHRTIVATVDDKGLPVTCAIDMMDADENSLYFLTAKGKSFYDRLIKRKFLAFTETGTTLDGKGKISTCVDYLKKLGVTHVQILPMYDYATVDEEHPDRSRSSCRKDCGGAGQARRIL